MVWLFVPERGDGDAGWLDGLRGRKASVRGRVRRTPRRRVVLVPDADAPEVRGQLIEVDEARLAVLDLIEGVGTGGLRRERVRAQSSLRMFEAEAYVTDPPPRGSRWR